MLKLNTKIYIVYNAFINPESNWSKFIKFQLNDLKRTGILEFAELHIVASNPLKIPNIDNYFNSINVPISSLEVYPYNHFEFPGIKKTHSLAFNSENAIITYFHTKGMTHRKKLFRNRHEILLTNLTFRNWKNTISHFQTDVDLDLAGLIPAKEGDFVWFNFWWSSASYLRTRVTPIICSDRFYYEKWLGHNLPNSKSHAKILNILKNSNETYTEENAVKYLKQIAWRNLSLTSKRRIEYYFSDRK
jgi:hypothetical protein